MNINTSSFNMNAEEALSLSRAVMKRYITGGKIDEHLEVETGIQWDTQIPIIGRMGLVGSKLGDTCDRSDDGSSLAFSEKKWQPIIWGGRESICAKDFPQLFKALGKAKSRDDYWNKEGSDEVKMILMHLGKVIEKGINRTAYFNDTAAALVADSGNITAGTTLKYFNALDGLFKQWFAEITTSASNYVAIAKNAESTESAQLGLGATDAIDTLRGLCNKVDPVFWEAWEDGMTPKIELTQGLFQNWCDFLEDKSLAFTLDRTEDGATKYSYRGIPIVVRYDWTNNIKAYEDLGDTLRLPNRAVLTMKENNVLGTLNENDLGNLEVFYDQTDKKVYVDYDMHIDVKHLDPELTAFAY